MSKHKFMLSYFVFLVICTIVNTVVGVLALVQDKDPEDEEEGTTTQREDSIELAKLFMMITNDVAFGSLHCLMVVMFFRFAKQISPS